MKVFKRTYFFFFFCCWSDVSARLVQRLRKTPVRGSVSVLPPVLGDSVCLCAPWRVCRCRCTPPPPLDGLERGVPRYNTRDSAPLPSGFSHVGSVASTPTRPRRFNVCPLTSASCCERSKYLSTPERKQFPKPPTPSHLAEVP